MIDRFEKFSFAISEISYYWHKLATDVMEEYGLKGPYAVYFTTLYRFPAGITAAKLSEICSRDKADVSRAISLFQKKGLITKDTQNQCGYRAPICLTDEGRKIARLINQKAEIAVENGGMGLTDADREVFYKTLELIASNLCELAKKGI